MPRSRPSIPDPTATTEGLQLTIKRRIGGGVDLMLVYPLDPDGPYTRTAAQLTAQQRANLADIFNAMVTAMRADRGYV